jgi:hypothetical protein
MQVGERKEFMKSLVVVDWSTKNIVWLLFEVFGLSCSILMFSFFVIPAPEGLGGEIKSKIVMPF